jgi:hypothetical protein
MNIDFFLPKGADGFRCTSGAFIPLRARYGMCKSEICAQGWEGVTTTSLLYVSHSKTPEGEMREIPLTVRLTFAKAFRWST